jgi:hypothetical protein
MLEAALQNLNLPGINVGVDWQTLKRCPKRRQKSAKNHSMPHSLKI